MFYFRNCFFDKYFSFDSSIKRLDEYSSKLQTVTDEIEALKKKRDSDEGLTNAEKTHLAVLEAEERSLERQIALEKQRVQNAFKNEILTPLGISHNSEITYERVKAMFERSFEANKMALARTFATPGPKMVFQGDDSADLTPFRFFRQFESAGNEHSLYVEKGYRTGEEALNDSKMGSIKYSPEARSQMNKFRNLTRDLNKLNEENKALQNGHIVAKNTIKHPGSQVIGTHLASDDHSNELFVVTNFSQSKYPREHADKYYIHFPEGRWVEVLNTDDKKYDGQGRVNSEMIYSDGKFAFDEENVASAVDGACGCSRTEEDEIPTGLPGSFQRIC